VVDEPGRHIEPAAFDFADGNVNAVGARAAHGARNESTGHG
jgi:hypothetical protein